MSETTLQKRKHQGALRSADADLKVIVGEDENQEVFWHYSTTLASQSGYVDTHLSTGLPTINDSGLQKDSYKQIAFPDIEPEQWETMMAFLDDPYTMTVEDVIELVMLYDKYDFKTGIKICDGVLMKIGLMFDFSDNASQCFARLENMAYTHFPKVDQYVDIIELSEKMNLKKTFYWGRAWLKFLFEGLKIRTSREGFNSGINRDFPLTAQHISQLIPTFTRDSRMLRFPEVLREYLNFEVFAKHYNGSGEEIGFRLKDTMFEFIGTNESIEMTNPLFPDWFILRCKDLLYIQNFAQENIKCIRVIDPDSTGIGGDYYYTDSGQDGFAFVNEKYGVLRFIKLDEWTLCDNFPHGPQGTTFVCEKSVFSILPPKTGWVDFHSGSKVNLKLEYVWK